MSSPRGLRRCGRCRSVARPRAGDLREPAGAGALDGGLRRGEDGALDRGGEDDLAHRVLALQRLGCVLRVGDPLPDLLEDHSRDGTGRDAPDEADRLVGQLSSLAQRLLLRCPCFLRQTTIPTTTATIATPAAI